MSPSRSWRSLQIQLPLAAAGLFVILAVALSLVAFFQVRALARDVADARLTRLAEDLAASTGLSTARLRERVAAAAADPAVIGGGSSCAWA